MDKKSVFLTATWEYLAMLNYPVPEEILLPYLPGGTQIDTWNGQAMVSVVGFLFNNTKVFGLNWPFHTHFEEVNLRFYIKHFDGEKWKRGVAFISEIVPKPAIAMIANKLYNEHYSYQPMKHAVSIQDDQLRVQYDWKYKKQWQSLSVTTTKNSSPILSGTEEEFIFEHYWGYNQLNKHTTIEYGVEHPRWEVYPVTDYQLTCDIKNQYGHSFTPYLGGLAQTAFLAKGSSVIIRKPRFIHF